MAIPKYHEFMLPLLRLAQDGKTHTMSEAYEEMARQFSVSDEDRRELLPSGQQHTFDNRVGWARTYLKKAGLLQSRERGTFEITPQGKDVLAEKPSVITRDDLMKFDGFREFQTKTNKTHEKTKVVEETEQTPEEVLEESFSVLYEGLRAELLSRVKAESPKFFERLVVDLLVKMGYGGSRKDAGQAIGKSADGGLDGIIKEDRLGLDVIYIQAKRWEETVGRPIVQSFAGSLEGVRAKRGILITTSEFSKQAQEYVRSIEKKIVLIDGEMLTRLMIEHDIGVSPVMSYHLKKVDSDFFSDE